MQAHSVVEVNDKIRLEYNAFLRVQSKTVQVCRLDRLAVSSPAMTKRHHAAKTFFPATVESALSR